MEAFAEDRQEFLSKCTSCGEEASVNHRRPHATRKYWIVSFAAHLLIAFTILLVIHSVYKPVRPAERQSKLSTIDHDSHLVGTVSSPLNHHARQYIDIMGPKGWDPNLYFGEPTYESDHAWEDIIRPRSFRLHRNEAKRLNFTDSVLVLPGQDFAAELGVIHNLHCLRRIRQTLYPKYYYPNASDDEMEHDRLHNLHCLEAIRSSVLCYPDLNPHPYFWSDDKYHPITVSSKVTRKCVDWEAFQEGLELRNFNALYLMKGTGPLA